MLVSALAEEGRDTTHIIAIAVIRKLSFLIRILLSERVSDPTGDPAIRF